MSSYPIAAAPDLLVALDPASPRPLYKQLYDGLRDGSLTGRLSPGTRLPSSRMLTAGLQTGRPCFDGLGVFIVRHSPLFLSILIGTGAAEVCMALFSVRPRH